MIARCIHSFNRFGLEGILPQEQHGAKYSWSNWSEQPIIDSPRQNCRQYGSGLIHWVSGKLYGAVSEHKNNALLRELLEQITSRGLSKTLRRTYVIVDNNGIHFAKSLQAWRVWRIDEAELIYWQNCSPHLNQFEHFWKHLRPRFTYTYFSHMVDRLKEAVFLFFMRWRLPMISPTCWWSFPYIFYCFI